MSMFWVKQITKNVAPVLLIAAFLLSNIIPFFGFTPRVQAISYDFFQTDWTTLDTISKATIANLSGWTKYVSKPSTDNTNFPVTVGAAVSVKPGSLIQTLPPDFPSGATFKIGMLTQSQTVSGVSVTGTYVAASGCYVNMNYCGGSAGAPATSATGCYVNMNYCGGSPSKPYGWNCPNGCDTRNGFCSYTSNTIRCAAAVPASGCWANMSCNGSHLATSAVPASGCWANMSCNGSASQSGSVASRMFGPFTATFLSSITSPIVTPHIMSPQPAGSSVTVVGVTQPTSTTVSYSLSLYSSNGTITVDTVSISANASGGPTTWDSPEYTITNASILANSTLALSSPNPLITYIAPQPADASATLVPGYPIFSNSSMVYKLRLTNTTTSALTVDKVTFTIASKPPVTGTLIPSPFNMADPAAVFIKLSWDEIIPDPAKTSVKFQVRTATDGISWTPWVGPTGAGSSFSSTDGSCTKNVNTVMCSVPAAVAQAAGPNTRYFQYQVMLDTTDSTITPTVDNVTARYTINTAPTVTLVSAQQSTTASNAGDIVVGYSLKDDDQSNFYVDMFYDVGLKLDSTLVITDDNKINFQLPLSQNADLAQLIPAEGVLLIDSEEIYYFNRGANYVSGLVSVGGQPLARGYGPAGYTTTAASHTAGTAVYVQTRTKSGNVGDGQSCTSVGATCTGKSISWKAQNDLRNFYGNINVKVIANDKELNRQLGASAASAAFNLDTKGPSLSSPISVLFVSSLIDVTGKGYKTNLPTVSFTAGGAVGAGSTDNAAANNFISSCTLNCGSPTGQQLLSGVSGWAAGTTLGSFYDYTVQQSENAVQTINLALFDYMGNTMSPAPPDFPLVYDKTPPPPVTNLSVQDISNSLGYPAMYISWTKPAWTTQKDAYGRQDFGSYIIYRDKFVDAVTGKCKDASASAPQSGLCPVQTLSGDENTTNYVDTAVANTESYAYRVVTRDDLGNQVSATDASILAGSGTASVEGAPKIIPTISSVSRVLQTKYTDPVTYYWSTYNPVDGQPLPSDSYVAYIAWSSAPAVADFDNAQSQGSAELKTAGIPAGGTCQCHKVILVGLQPNTQYWVQMRSSAGSDPGKSFNASDALYTFTTMPEPAKITPTITAVQATQITSNSAVITWTTDTKDPITGQQIGADSFVEYGTSKALGSYYGAKDNTTLHSVALSGLIPGTSYFYRVHSTPQGRDDGKEAIYPPYASSPLTFTTNVQTTDTTPPTIDESTVRATPQQNSATITWKTPDEPSSSIVEFWTGAESHTLWEPNPGELVLDHQVQLSSTLQPKTTYSYRVISYDAAAPPNRAQSQEYSFTTLDPTPIATPVIANIRNDAPSPNSVIIYWSTNVESDSTVFYSKDATSFNLPPGINPILTISHIVTLVGLDPGQQYFYKVQSKNSQGTLSADDAAAKTCTGNPCSFTTPLAPVPAPQVVTSGPQKISVVDIGEHSATIKWTTTQPGNSLVEFGINTMTDQLGIQVPTYERNFYGNVKNNTTDHTVTLPSNLIDGVAYHFRVYTRDAAGQIALFPANPTPIDNPSDSYPSCADDSYNCLDPSLKTVISQFTQALDTKEELAISGVAPLLVTDTTAVIGWTTNRLADSEVDYGESPTFGCLGGTCPLGKRYKTIGADGSQLTDINALTRTHAVDLTGLRPSTTYYYKVTSTDVADISKTADNNGAGFSFTTNEGTKAVSQAELDQKQNELDALKVQEQQLRAQLADQTLTAAEIAALQAQLAANLTRQQELQGQITQQLQIDRTPPIISNIAVSDVAEDSATVAWDTNEDASSNVFYGETAEYSQLAGKGSSYFKKHAVTLSDLNPGTLYHFSAVSYDTSANRAQSEDATFATKGIKGEKQEKIKEEPGESTAERIKKLPPGVRLSLDKITMLLKEFSEEEVARILNEAGLQLVSPPKFTAGEPMVKVAETIVTISWKTNKDSDSRVAYKEHATFDERKENPYGSEVGDADAFTQEHEVILENLQPGTLYHYQLRSREQAGRSAKSIDRTFRTKPITPEATGIVVTDRTEHTATIEWKTNVPTKASVEYKNLRTEQERSQGDPQFTTMHELTLIELEPDTKYEAVIRSENELEVSAVSKKFSFATVKDITPPEVSQVRTELSLIPGKSDVVQAVISWRTNEQTTGRVLYDEGLQKDRELRQSTAVGEDLAATHVMVLNKLRPLTIYTFKIVSQDTAGNIGTSKEFKIITPRKEQSVLELIISNFENIFGFLREL